MKKIFFPVFNYLFEHEKARIVLYWSCVLGLMFCAWPLDGWRYAGVIVIAIALHTHGMIDATRMATDNMEK